MTEMAPVNLFHELVEPVSKDGLMNRLTGSVVQETSVLVMTSICAWESCPRSTQGQHNGCRKGPHIDGCS
jgi:hypothetical protein